MYLDSIVIDQQLPLILLTAFPSKWSVCPGYLFPSHHPVLGVHGRERLLFSSLPQHSDDLHLNSCTGGLSSVPLSVVGQG